jgi:hypothetical protein
MASHCASDSQNAPATIQALQPIRLESQHYNHFNPLIEFGA